MGVKILFFSCGTLGQNSMFPEKGGQNSIFFPSALKKGGQNCGAYQPTSLKGCPPPPGPLVTNFSEIFNHNSCIFVQENPFENVVWIMVAILSRPQCVKLA